MPRSVIRKDQPLSMRLPEADIAVIDRAAGLRGRSRTDFIREAAVQAAEAAIVEQALIRMTADGFEAFRTAVSAAPRPVPEMIEVLRRSAPWEREPRRRRS